MEYAVKAETYEGKVLTLRRGFASQEEAEDHPIQMSRWKRVWVEPIDDEAEQNGPRRHHPHTAKIWFSKPGSEPNSNPYLARNVLEPPDSWLGN